jgi:hypothetical protein
VTEDDPALQEGALDPESKSFGRWDGAEERLGFPREAAVFGYPRER